MAYSLDELYQLYGNPSPISSLSPVEEEPVVEEPTVRFRRAKQAVNTIPKAIGTIAGGLVGLGNVLQGEKQDAYVEDAKNLVPHFDTGETKGWVDIGLDVVAPEMAAWMIPYLGASKGLAALGTAGRIAEGAAGLSRASLIANEGLATGLANLVTGSAHGISEDNNPLASGALGTVSGALQAGLPRLPRAAALAGVSGLFGALTGNWKEAGANFVGTMLPGAVGHELKSVTSPHLAPSKFGNLDQGLHEGIPDNYEIHDVFANSLSKRRSFDSAINENPGIDETYDAFKGLERYSEPTGLKLAENQLPSLESNGLPFYHNPDTSHLRLGEESTPRFEGPQFEQPVFDDPSAVNFSLIDTPIKQQTPHALELFDWRTNKFNEHQVPRLEYNKPAATGEIKPIVEAPTPSSSVDVSWKVKEPDFHLTKGEKEFYDWARSGAKDILEDTGWQQDNPNFNTIEDQLEDLKYRISTQARGMAGNDATTQQLAGRLRVIDSLENKLEKAGFFNKDYHVEKPLIVRSPKTNEVVEVTPTSDKPHVLSTALRDEEGNIYKGEKFNSGHNEIKLEDPSKEFYLKDLEHGFLIQKEKGKIEFTTDRKEAGELAVANNQQTKEYRGDGNFHSHHLESLPGSKVEQDVHVANLERDKMLKEVSIIEKNIVELQRDAKEALRAKDYELAKELDGSASRLRMDIAKRKAAFGESGQAITPLMSAIVAGSAGGLYTYYATGGDAGESIAAAIAVAGLGTAGIKAFEHLRATKGEEAVLKGVKVPNETVAEKLTQFAKETKQTKAGLAVGGRGGITANALSAAEGFFGMNKWKSFVHSKLKGDGFIADVLNQQVNALRAVSKYKPTDAFAEASGQFLRGQLADKAAVQNLLNSGGIISGEEGAWNSLTSSQKKLYPERWLQVDDVTNTNTKGEGVTVWHVTNDVKRKLVKQEHDALMRMATTPEDKEFAKYAIESRKNFDTLQSVVFEAAGPKEAARIVGTMGQYMTRSHALLADPKFYPEPKIIDMAMAKLGLQKTANFLANNQAPVGAPSVVKRSFGGKDFYLEPSKADLYDNLYTPESLRAIVTQRIKDLKDLGAQAKAGLFKHDEAAFSNSLFSGRKELDDMTRVLLGEHNSPLEMIRDTTNKLIPAARAAHVMADMTKAVDPVTGIPGRFTSEIEYSKAINRVKDLLKKTTDPRVQREIQNQLNDLTNYLPVGSSSPKMGLFQGSFVSRHVYNQLEEMMNPLGDFEDVIGTGLRHFNNLFKETHLVANPITQARNFMQIPMMMVIGRAAHDFNAIKTAFNMIYKGDNTSDVARWAIRNGATSGNAVHGELNFGLKELLDGTADKTLGRVLARHTTETSGLKAIAKGEIRAGLHLLYAKPDDFVRVSTFIAAARRQAKKLGIAEDQMHLSDEVTDFARDFMQRRSMDYANVPQWVKAGRQIPLISPFLTYTHEVVRITKNMAMDAAKGDLVSGAGLAALSSLPFLAQQMAEDALSPQDREDWEKGQAAAADYSRPRFKLPMSRNKDGTFNYYDITPILPFGDYMMMGRAAAKGDFSSVVAANPIAGLDKSPLMNLIASQVTGEDLRTHRDFKDNWDRAKNVIREITPPLTPGIGYEWEKTAPEALGGRLGVTNLKNGRTSTIKGALMRNILGVDESQVNPDIAVSNAIKSAQHDIANERQIYKDTVMSQGLSDEAKERAYNRYVEAIQYLTNQLEEKLNPTKQHER